jgi:hypothetical protein
VSPTHQDTLRSIGNSRTQENSSSPFTILIAVGYLVLWFYWQGKNWARWIVLIECFQCFWNLKYLFHPNPKATPFEPMMIVAEAAIAIYLVWYLNTPTVREWFQNSGRAAHI